MMQAPKPKKEDPIFRLASNPRQAMLLTRRIYMLVLWALRDHPKTISEVAKTIGESLETTSYRVRKLEQAGIIGRVEGAPKRFKAALHWEIPSALLPKGTLEEFMAWFMRGGLERATGAFVEHFKTTSDAWSIRMDFRTGQYPEFRPQNAQTDWVPLLEGPILHLKPNDARALRAEMQALVNKFKALHDPARGQAHLLGVLFTREITVDS